MTTQVVDEMRKNASTHRPLLGRLLKEKMNSKGKWKLDGVKARSCSAGGHQNQWKWKMGKSNGIDRWIGKIFLGEGPIMECPRKLEYLAQRSGRRTPSFLHKFTFFDRIFPMIKSLKCLFLRSSQRKCQSFLRMA